MQKFHSVLLSPLLSLSLSQSCSSSWGQTTPDVIAWVNTIYGFNSLHWLSGAIYHPLLFFFFFPVPEGKMTGWGKNLLQRQCSRLFFDHHNTMLIKADSVFPCGHGKKRFSKFCGSYHGQGLTSGRVKPTKNDPLNGSYKGDKVLRRQWGDAVNPHWKPGRKEGSLGLIPVYHKFEKL